MLIVGTGAVATLLAERFWSCGIVFQIFGAPSERLRSLGRRFGGCTVSRPEDIAAHRRWIVAVKTSQNAEKVQSLRRAVGPEAILVLQNGLDPQSDWQSLAERVERALCTYGVKSVAPGRIEGGRVGEITLSLGSTFRAELSRAGFFLREVGDLSQAIWQKLAVNASLNVVAALYGVPNGSVLESSEASRLVRSASTEVAEVARRIGVQWGPRSAWDIARSVASNTADNVCSTLSDIRSGRPTEYRSINGEVLAIAEQLKVPVPTLKELDIVFQALITGPSKAVCA